MAFKFEDLRVWQEALRLSNEMDRLTKTFPKNEMYSLASQMKRAADSVALNIAEGSTGQTNPEFRRFLSYSLRSAIEVVACLFMAKERLYVDDIVFKKYYADYDSLCKKVTTLRNSLKRPPIQLING
jgi:four helix bundle protein